MTDDGSGDKSGLHSKESSQENKQNVTIHRRSLLKSSGVGAFSLLGLGLGNISHFKTVDRTTRIVAARRGVKAEPIYTKKVPKRWLNHQKAIRNVTEQLWKQFGEKSFVDSISYSATDRMEGGVYYSEPEITVRPDTTDDQLSALPDALEQTQATRSHALVGSDIKVRRMNGEFVAADVDCHDDVTALPFHGGIEIQDASRDMTGTSGCRATDGDSQYLYTANHVVADACHIGTGWVNDTHGDPLGHGANGHKTHDWVMINEKETRYSDYIWHNDGLAKVHGYATQDGMESIQGQKGTLRFQGKVSGYQDAHVKGGGATKIGSCMKWFGSAIKIGMPDYGRQGDSGGPFWWPTSSGNHIVTVLSGVETTGSYTGCGLSGLKGRPAYGYPFWRIANNTKFTIN